MSRANRLRKKKAKNARKLSLMHTQPPPDFAIMVSPFGQNMSEVLLDFLDPYLDECSDQEAVLRNLLAMGVVAWNAAILPADEAAALIDNFLAKVPAGQIREDGKALLNMMVDRKRQHYPANQRRIYDLDVTMTPEGPRVLVLSNLNGRRLSFSLVDTASVVMAAFARWVIQGVRRLTGG